MKNTKEIIEAHTLIININMMREKTGEEKYTDIEKVIDTMTIEELREEQESTIKTYNKTFKAVLPMNERYARKCDVTGKGMNEGWCWGDGSFYTSTEEDTLKECRKDRSSILLDIDSFDYADIQNGDNFDEFEQAVKRAKENKDTDKDLLIIGYQTGYLYYTEWYETLEEDEEYYTESGELIEA